MIYKAKLTSKGQLTIPVGLRREMGLREGSYLEIKETAFGYVIQKQVDEKSLKKYAGILGNEKESDEVIKKLRG